MNLSAVAAFRPTASFQPARLTDDPTPAPAPDPTPAPAPAPAPDIDFTNIDTPQKAALLPSLNAATFMLALNAMSNALQGGAALTSSLQMTLGQATQISANYEMADPNSATLTGKGTAGAADFQETWSLGMDGLNIAGTIGNSAEALALTVAPDGTNKIDGTVGGLEVHETLSAPADGSNGIVFAGTIGDQAFNQTLSILQADPNTQPTIHVEGNLGDAAIKYDETITSQNESSITLAAQGDVAGTPMQFSQSFAFAPPAPPAPPSDPNPPSPARG